MAAEIYFGPFRLDLRAGELFKGATRMRVQQHPLRLLQLLIDAQGMLVTREEIRSRLWPNGTIVDFEHSINSAINKLRAALADTAEDPTYVETVARKGYRFLAPVRRVGEPVEMPSQALGSLQGGSEISHYRVQELIARGGMGLVYRAVDVYLNRSVALKILPDASPDGITLQRFHNEARTLSGLEHPNICTVYEFGEHLGRPFMAMQLLDGETIKDRIARLGPLDTQALVSAAIDIANGLDAAHRQGIIHQDIKPSNLFLTRSGQAKVLDFGIATLVVHRDAASSGSPQEAAPDAGSVPGTAAYMSPEQIRGGNVDPRTDIFSLGLVLYEMATGRHAFAPDSTSGTNNAIQNAEPLPPSRFNPALSVELERTILKALEKDPEKRFASAADLREAMERINTASHSTAAEPLTRSTGRRGQLFAWLAQAPRRALLAGVVALTAVAGIVPVLKNRADRTWAQASVSRVERLAAAGAHKEGYDVAVQVLRILPGEPTMSRLMYQLSDDLSVSTTPPGAEVSLRRLGSSSAEPLGLTPIQHVTVARGEFIISIRKAGYADFERTLSSALERRSMTNKRPWEIRIEQRLREASKSPQGMALVPGGEYKLQGWSRVTEASAKLSDYYIDKFEVSNRDFKVFIDTGGYNQRQFWGPHNDTGIFRDKTRLPGPRGWVRGTFPDGKQAYPVTGITWPEASAYCQSSGKDLPTLFQWEKAARGSMWTPFGVVLPWGVLDPTDVARRANFESTGPTAVDSFEFGMSPFGVYNMAGNVAEWMRNSYDDGFTVGGGAWNEPIYQFGGYSPRPALYSAETLGFRCAMMADGVAGDQGGMRFSSARQAIEYPVSTDREFQASKLRYAYERRPLHAAVLAAEETEAWRREEVAFDGFGGERASAFLYLPKSAVPPYQVIQFLGGDSWFYGTPVTQVVEKSSRVAPYIRAGRAVFLVVLKGFAGREPAGAYGREPAGAYGNLEFGSRQHRDILVSWAVDMQRGLDYLETRSDIDTRKIALMNHSTFEVGAVFAGVDQRYSSVILIGAGVFPELLHVPPEVNPLHFVPHIRAPKLMLNGRYDDGTSESTAEPLFRLMRGPKKRSVFIGGHIPPPEIAVPLVNGFLDETLGPVSRK